MKCIKCGSLINNLGWWVDYQWCWDCAVKYPDEIMELANNEFRKKHLPNIKQVAEIARAQRQKKSE